MNRIEMQTGEFIFTVFLSAASKDARMHLKLEHQSCYSVTIGKSALRLYLTSAFNRIKGGLFTAGTRWSGSAYFLFAKDQL